MPFSSVAVPQIETRRRSWNALPKDVFPHYTPAISGIVGPRFMAIGVPAPLIWPLVESCQNQKRCLSFGLAVRTGMMRRNGVLETMNIRPDYATIEPEEFFAWVSGQEGRYELVEGEVVMMAGAGRRHDAIVVNLIAAIRPQPRSGPCHTFTDD